MSDGKITITIDESDVVERAAEVIIRSEYRSSDDDEESHGIGFGSLAERMRRRINDAVMEQVGSAIDEGIDALIQETIRAKVGPMIDERVAKGFVERDRYGDVSATRRSFETYVQASVDNLFKKANYHDSWAVKAGRESFDKHIGAAFKTEAERIRKTIRKYVDEQLAGAVIKSLRESVGLNG